jgi:hypothetical protein
MSATRTRGMTAIAVLNVILGAVATLGSAAMIATGMGLLPGSPPPYNQSPPGGVVAFGCARLVVSLLLIASGIGVFRMKPLGRTCAIAAAVLWIAVNLVEPLALRYPFGPEVLWGSLYSALLLALFMRPGWTRAFAGTAGAAKP